MTVYLMTVKRAYQSMLLSSGGAVLHDPRLLCPDAHIREVLWPPGWGRCTCVSRVDVTESVNKLIFIHA